MTINYAVRRVQEEHNSELNPQYIQQRLGYSTYVNFDRKYLYYEVPKAACTWMKLLIHSLEKLPPITPFVGHHSEVRRDMFIHERSEFKLPSLMEFDDEKQEYILTSPEFFRFTIVRNPYTRLQSAWKEKVQACAPGFAYLYEQMKGRLPQGNHPDSFITFSDFVTAISRHDLAASDPHWRLQVEHLFYRAMNFKLVGRAESLQEAVSIFVKRAGFAPAQFPPPTNTSRWSSAYDQALADKVYALYERDFVDLGYAKDSWKSRDKVQESPPDTVSEARFLDEITERNIVINHLYLERANLQARLRQLVEEPKGETSAEACRSIGFDKLFDQYVSRIDGWVTKEEATYLYRLAKEAAEGCIVEVGSYRGRSTAALAFGVNAGAGLPVYAVEPHERVRGLYGGEFGPVDRGYFMRAMRDTGLFHHVRLVNVSSEFLGDEWPMPVSVLFIDGDHRYEAVKRDLECWRGKLTTRAMVVLDDASDPSRGPGQLAQELVDGGTFVRQVAIGKMVCLRYSPSPDGGLVRSSRDEATLAKRSSTFAKTSPGEVQPQEAMGVRELPATQPGIATTAAAPRRNKISGLVISYNRADVIETCLRSLRFADELIVVDKSSDDGTVEIARRYADKVIVVPWSPVVEDTRAEVISLCANELIVCLDDDECLSPDAIKFILREADNPTADIYRLPVHSYIFGRFDERRADWPDYKDKLFRRGSLDFSTSVHAGPNTRSSKILVIPLESPILIHHFSVPTVSNWIEKTNRYTSQPQRVGWVDRLPLSTDLPKQSIDHWLRKGHKPDSYLIAFVLSRMVYDIVDKLKRWEVEAGVDGKAQVVNLCKALQSEYDKIEQSLGVPNTRADSDQPVSYPQASK